VRLQLGLTQVDLGLEGVVAGRRDDLCRRQGRRRILGGPRLGHRRRFDFQPRDVFPGPRRLLRQLDEGALGL